jgi:hypothetical protein
MQQNPGEGPNPEFAGFGYGPKFTFLTSFTSNADGWGDESN